jgi:hypothetical protein
VKGGYAFFPIPNHLRIFAIKLAIGPVYAVPPIKSGCIHDTPSCRPIPLILPRD